MKPTKPLTPTYKTIEYKGEHRTLREWSKILNIPYITLYFRMRKDYPIEKVFSRDIPLGTPKRKSKV